MTVLCVVAHPVDEVLGAGGTLAGHAAAGEDVYACVLSNGVTERDQEVTDDVQAEIDRRTDAARTAADVLGLEGLSVHAFPVDGFETVPLADLVEKIAAEVDRHEPDVVYTHHPGTLDADHEHTARATMEATRPLGPSPVDRVLAFETRSSGDWDRLTAVGAGMATTFVDVEDALGTKVDALEVYDDDLLAESHCPSVEQVRADARRRGVELGMAAAEAFTTLREVRPAGGSSSR